MQCMHKEAGVTDEQCHTRCGMTPKHSSLPWLVHMLVHHFQIYPVVTVQAAGIPESLVRLSIGIEDTEDLLQDIRGALNMVSTSFKET